MDAQVAEYTRQLAVFTLWLVIATILVALIGLAVGVAQAIISRSTARRQLRAYVFVDSITLADSSQSVPMAAARPPSATAAGAQSDQELQVSAPQAPNRPGVGIVVKNSGQTPAYDVVHWGPVRRDREAARRRASRADVAA